MLRYKTFYKGYSANNEEFDCAIDNFLQKLSTDGNSLIDFKTTTYGSDNSGRRTEIVYLENSTRKVIVEKINNEEQKEEVATTVLGERPLRQVRPMR